MTPAPGAPPGWWRGWRHAMLLALLCGGAVALYVIGWRGAIAGRVFGDADDALRLQQVRDLIGGQGWFDLTQYRLNPPTGVAMHWSRLVDAPIAGLILLLRPLLGGARAETAALVAVPCLTLIAAMLASASLARRLLGAPAGLAAAGLAPLTVAALQQMRPLRIDHHGWQVVLCVGIARALLARAPGRGGLLAGLFAAIWLAISLEGLPFAAAAGAVAAWGWLREPDAGRARLEGYGWGLAAGAAGLLAATRAGGPWGAVACDALSPLQLATMIVAAAGASLVTRIGGGIVRRVVGLVVLGAACAGVYAFAGGQCAAGAFGALDPLVETYWYRNVLEGMPLWRQTPTIAVISIGYPCVGLAGALLRGGEDAWRRYAALLAAALLAAVMVQRSAAMANLLALPGGIALTAAGLARIARWRAAPARIGASAMLLLATLPLTPALVMAARAADAPAHPPPACGGGADFAGTARLPRGVLLAGIDLGPELLLAGPHAVVASAHHRNVSGLHDVIAAFMGDEATAHAIVRRRGVAYMLACADSAEMAIYARAAPRGLWARLKAGRPPRWLAPVPLRDTRIRVWRVTG